MSHYKPYPVYKDSGVEWLGTVPEHWAVHRMKSLIDSAQNGIWGILTAELMILHALALLTLIGTISRSKASCQHLVKCQKHSVCPGK